MSGLRTLVVSAGLLLGALPSQAAVSIETPRDQLRIFATCTGRLSALMEHQWMFDGPLSEVTEARRDDFIALVEALGPHVPGVNPRDVMHWRVEAKAAYRRLLERALFNDDRREAKMAARRAEVILSECDNLLLG